MRRKIVTFNSTCMFQLKNNKRLMPHVINMAIFLIVFASCGPTNRSQSRQWGSTKENDSLLVDANGNRYIIKLFTDNTFWMTTNLQSNIPGSFCYENSEENCKQFGRLYTWESALKGCNLLGEGWRLPTNADWQQMAKQFGGVRDDSEDKGNAAYTALLDSGNAAFNVLLGGGRDPQGKYARLNAHGFFWTATETGTTTAWMYNFGKGSLMLNRHSDGEKLRAFSVRCVKNINPSK